MQSLQSEIAKTGNIGVDSMQKIIKQFPENPDMQILNGRYGPYIAYQKKNYKIPENVNPADLNLDACFKVIELQAQKAEMRKAKGAKAKTKK